MNRNLLTSWTIPVLTAILLTMPGCRIRPARPAARMPLKTESKLVYNCYRVSRRALVIDGVLDEKAWAAAPLLSKFQTAGPKPVSAKLQTEARLLWSRSHLYVGYICVNDGIRPAGKKRDDPIWNGDAAELFVCPGGAEKPYYEIDINPDAVIYDTRILDWRYEQMSKHWQKWALGCNLTLRSAVRIRRNKDGAVTGWSTEMAISLRELVGPSGAPPRPGDEWLFNVFRAAKPAKGGVEFSTWAPTFADFHRPYMFPRLVFKANR